ncbi:hypothetical protein [Sinorhizobium fredii]|uniref:hypothetical protein n=1 Tax=Rhizobium fredii TaxID=380 RepID=UPI003519C936
MPAVDVFEHMEEAWKLERNPFPAEAIRAQHAEQPYSPAVFSEEENAFRRKLIRGAVSGGQAIGFLWSQGARADTGFGKTTLMQEITHEINSDLGATTLEKAGAKKAQPPIAAAFSNLNNLNAAGLYPVLFNAVIDLATAPDSGSVSVFDKARARIVEKLGQDDADAIAERVREAWITIGGTGGPLRSELVDAFAAGGSKLRSALAAVTTTARLRNGLQYLDFALAALAAAGIDHLFLMIDQLEDLATNRSVTSPKRSREIGRIRDLLESASYATRLHMIFTFHNRAAQVLDRFWEENRLPPFEISASNTSAVVVLRGLKETDQAEELLRVYLEDARLEPFEDDLLPFESGAVEVLREISDGRPGILLSRARELLNAAAEQALPKISGTFTRKYFDGQAMPADADDRAEAADFGDDIDDLLLGSR